VAITSPFPQTTRNAIRGIVNRPEGQIVFLDTPGYHESDKKLNLYLKDVVHRALDDADTVLYVLDGSRPPGREESAVMSLLGKSGKPVVAAVNKTDLALPLLAEIRGLVQAQLRPAALIDVSALYGTNLEQLVQAVMNVSPEGELLYPADFYTDQNPEFRISEIIREQAIMRCEKEVPHALYVEIADMEFRNRPAGTAMYGPGDDDENPPPEESAAVPAGESAAAPAGAPPGFFENEEPSARTEKRETLWVRAFLVVERPSQVGILVGHQGARIKSIRIGSLKVMKRIFPWKISLDIRVKVNSKWRSRDPLLKRMIGSDSQR
jgi:GTP-binding protein Era